MVMSVDGELEEDVGEATVTATVTSVSLSCEETGKSLNSAIRRDFY